MRAAIIACFATAALAKEDDFSRWTATRYNRDISQDWPPLDAALKGSPITRCALNEDDALCLQGEGGAALRCDASDLSRGCRPINAKRSTCVIALGTGFVLAGPARRRRGPTSTRVEDPHSRCATVSGNDRESCGSRQPTIIRPASSSSTTQPFGGRRRIWVR